MGNDRRRREKGSMDTQDYSRMLLKESRAKAACLCIHHDTRVEFGGWAKCANASIPSGRIHTVKNTYLGDCGNKGAYTNVDNGSQQKASSVANIKPSQRIAVFRRKTDKKVEEEFLRFCHFENVSDHIRNYRDKKHGLFVEKVRDNYKAGPPLRLIQARGNFQDVCFPDLESNEMNRPDSTDEKLISARKLSKFHRIPPAVYNSGHSNTEHSSKLTSHRGGSILQTLAVVDSGIGQPQVIGKAAPVCFEGELVTNKCSKGSRDSVGSLTQSTVSEHLADFSAWVPENAVYQSRSSSAKMHNSVGYLLSGRPTKDTQTSSVTFQPLQPRTSYLRKSKYPPSLLFHEKQEDQITVKSSRSKDGKVHTRIEFFSMTAPEQKQLSVVTTKREKRVHYLEPLSTAVSDEKITDRKGTDHCGLVDHCDDHHQRQSYPGRLLSGRMKSGKQQVTEEDLQQLAIGKQITSDENTKPLYNGKSRARKRFYHIEKQDSTRSIPSKSIVRKDLCDLQIQPSVSSSALIHQDNSSDTTVSSSSSTLYHSRRTDDRQTAKQECVNELIVNCPTVINSSLLASPYKSHSSTNESGRVLSSVERCTHNHLRNSGHRRSIHSIHSLTSSNGASRPVNQILLNSHTERFLPSSKQHGRIKLCHALTERRESDSSSINYRVTLSGGNINSVSAGVHHQMVNDSSSRCMLRSHQRRKVQLQKNILGNLSGKKVEHNSNVVLRAHKKAKQPVKVCLRGTKKKIIDLLRTNSNNSVLDIPNSELPELYAE